MSERVPVVNAITSGDDLRRIVDEINSASWDDANEMPEYSVETLADYLDRQDTVFVACHGEFDGESTLLGIAFARFEVKSYGGKHWLYVDEVDVCADRRRLGAGKLIMRKLIEIAGQAGCEEVWLGTEATNEAANALYRSLGPDDVMPVIGYTYKLGNRSA